uniref:Uncharacterized protein n=1 Tax=Avena sativa TaxID=4498 RepID=A0ACD5XVW7_AVESA
MEVVTGAMGSLLPKLGELLIKEYKLQKGVKKNIGFLQKEMRSMHAALIKVAEVPWDQLDKQVKIWADDVRDLSYDMEDVVDNFLVCVEGSDAAADSHKLKGLMEKMSNLFAKGKARYEIANAIKEIKDRADEVLHLRERYKVDDVVANKAVDPRLLALFKNQKDLIDIEGPRQDIKRLMIGGDGGVSKKQLKIVSICGVGGLGKTTLAKAMYDRLQENFDSCAFVSVGRNPDVKKVFKDILLELDENEGRVDLAILDEAQLIKKLRRLLENRRYFIVIDDVWDLKAWELIECAMVKNNRGSRIIITTRITEVAVKTGHVYKLKPLSHDSSKELFYLRLFGGKEKCPYDQPTEMTNKLLRKCGGVPLAIITIASLLVGKPLEVWPKVYTSIGFGDGVNTDVENMRKILSFSYYDLPWYLRSCLLHLSIYPEDTFIRKDSLIWKWIAEGFVREEQGVSLFETGEGYFSELVNRNMVQPVEDNKNFVICGCRVHDMVLDMICLLSKELNFVNIVDSNGKYSSSKGDTRRLVVQTRVKEEWDPLANTSMLKVRSCYATMCDLGVMPTLSRFQVLRVVAMENCSFKEDRPYHLEHLRRLPQLRYLSFENTPISEIPGEIGYLKFLQTLDLRGTRIKELPQSIGLLRKLKCLRADGNNVGISLPDWIGNLTSLEELCLRITTTTATATAQDDESSIFQLGKLTELRVLICSFTGDLPQQSKKTFVESICKLRKIQVLRFPGLWWSDLDADTWNSYEPPRHLRELFILSGFIRFPVWIRSSPPLNLSTLHMKVHDLEEQDMAALGRLTELRALATMRIPAGMEFPDGSFPKLRKCLINAPFRFLQGSMLGLESITFIVVVRYSKDAYTGFDFISSLGNLPSLRNVRAYIHCSGASAKDVEEVDAAVRQAIDAHPNCPTLSLDRQEEYYQYLHENGEVEEATTSDFGASEEEEAVDAGTLPVRRRTWRDWTCFACLGCGSSSAASPPTSN